MLRLEDVVALDGLILARACSEVRRADKVSEYLTGKDKLLGFFVGQVMKATGGKANPALLNERLKAKLAG